MPTISLKPVWVDDDGMLQLEIAIRNATHAMVQDFYAYPENLSAFAEQLIAFGASSEDKATFEYGVGENTYCYFLLAALCVDRTGHSAIEVKFDNRKPPPLAASGHFFLLVEPATVNAIGSGLRSWLGDPAHEFESVWSDA